MAFDPSAIWAIASGGFSKGNNFLAGNGYEQDTNDTRASNAMGRQNFSEAIGGINERLSGRDEFNRQISGEAAKRYAELASMYPELWGAKRKARYQSGALSALGGV